MKLLFDQNLSYRLPTALADILPTSAHVRDFGMERADDQAVWNFAGDQGFTITSKDDDFRERARLYGHPPRVVLMKLGNCTIGDIATALRNSLPDITRLHQNPNASLLLITRDTTLLLVKHELNSP